MKYLIFIYNQNQPKNKLQEAIQNVLANYNRQIIHEDNIRLLFMELGNQVAHLNRAHVRCAAEEVNHFKKGASGCDVAVNAGQKSEKDHLFFVANTYVALYAMNPWHAYEFSLKEGSES
jgi:hypothetical protein